jgi:23S rRNA (pseudouridine1915-N3)-methyltransferase
MHLRVAAVGQRAPAWVGQAWQDYSRRLPATLGLELREIPVAHRGRNADIERLRKQEGEALLAAAAGARIVALDIAGAPWTTEKLSCHMSDWMQGGQDVCFLIGGPDGLDAECLARAEQRWSLGALTLPHALVRVVLAEQLYRAWSILQNHPYHRA